ncbi:S8 family peptidase [Roseovarius sp. EL26]|uniref:S8 family peptidase n=1 Tax=Roseovarius sp. EL26 TaxID=2126672 RepID=UPI000EA2DB4F|nr:S8 family peptidase [Roseovarius sp. EL26]
MDFDEYEENFDPTDLESMIVSRPLLERIAQVDAKPFSSESTAKTQQLSKTIPVVIDLNFSFPGGLNVAKANVLKLLNLDNIEQNGELKEVVFKRKTRLTPQYIFARLTPETIRRLAAHFLSGGEEAKIAPSFKEREVYMIWPDFEVERHVHRTVATIKADASRKSFSAEGEGVVWAVLDSGISGDHWHFKRHDNLDLDTLEQPVRHMDFTQDWPDPLTLPEEDRDTAINEEKDAALTDSFGHGTHVAGIIAGEYLADADAGWGGRGKAPQNNLTFKKDACVSFKRRTENNAPDFSSFTVSHIPSMAPLAKLVSFKVLDDRGAGQVSNIIAALAQIQEINEYGRVLRIHGVNLSVGYSFDPKWFACGQSPLCVEVDRLVKSGVSVVVSAGNSGYGTKRTEMTKNFPSGMLMTINDPGNARLALTVGSTHRDRPHEYGPSYFSSKGPTGDGRYKPDVLAPGERIFSCATETLAQQRGKAKEHRHLYVDQTGTSMAAPHVSGAIAAFLSVRREFIGQPERVKEIFINTATDLGRDRYMQGAGLIDLMRAIQSI